MWKRDAAIPSFVPGAQWTVIGKVQRGLPAICFGPASDKSPQRMFDYDVDKCEFWLRGYVRVGPISIVHTGQPDTDTDLPGFELYYKLHQQLGSSSVTDLPPAPMLPVLRRLRALSLRPDLL